MKLLIKRSKSFLCYSSCSGKTLMELMVALTISMVVFIVTLSVLHQNYKEIGYLQSRINVDEALIDIIYNMRNSCSIANTLNHPENSSKLICLKNDSCSSNLKDSIVLSDSLSRTYNDTKGVNIGYSKNGSICNYNATAQTNDCMYKVSANYKLECELGNCRKPLIELDINLSTQDSVKQKSGRLRESYSTKIIIDPVITYSSCQDAFDNGNTNNGIYYIDMDGFGGECPFQIFCDMSNEVGKALILNATTVNYASIDEVAPPLMPNQTGRLPKKYFNYFIQKVNSRFKINVDTSEYGDLSVRTGPTSLNQNSKLISTPNSCNAASNIYSSGVVAPDSSLVIIAQSASGVGEIGFSDKIINKVYEGFKCDTGCNSTNICGIAGGSCCSSRLKGSLWVN